ncbi:MAG: hypothetical protein M3530_06600 [Thermoproteota archaeon]|nr:hypothetical protein [Thermoproteota archaeon]
MDTLETIGDNFGVTSELLLQKGICNYRLGYLEDAISCCEDSIELDQTNERSKKLLEKLQYRLKAMRDYTCPIYQ